MTTLTLAMVQKEFDAWRASRTKIGKIPDHLWDKALTLLQDRPMSEITRVLGISSGQIRARRAQSASMATTKAKPPSKFMEISTPNMLTTTFSNPVTTCKLSLTRADGAKIMLEQVPEHTLMQILNNFFMTGGVACCN